MYNSTHKIKVSKQCQYENENPKTRSRLSLLSKQIYKIV